MPIDKTPDVSAALRELLIARNAGKIGAAEFERRQAELHARLLAAAPAAGQTERWRIILPLAVAAVAVLGGIGLFAWLGSPHPAASGPAETAQRPAGGGNAQAEQQVKSLTAEVTRNPMNGEAWAALARSYAVLDQHLQAVEAYAKAAAILPPDAALLSDWVDSYVMSHGRRWDETSRGLVKRALAADPKHLKSLSLAATDAFDQGDYKAALAYWKRMTDAAPGDARVAEYVAANVAEATALLGGKPAGDGGGGPPPAAAAITGRVSIAAALKARAAPGDTVFVIARSGEGRGPPLAVKRYAVADLPTDFQLDDAAAIMPELALSKALNVIVIARVSKSGNPAPQPGDLESAAQPLRVGARDVKLEIDTVR